LRAAAAPAASLQAHRDIMPMGEQNSFDYPDFH